MMQAPQMPGQAPQLQAPMPPKQPNTPAAQVGALEGMDLNQLVQLYQNPNPSGPPLYAIIAAISEKQKQAMEQMAMQRQMAMGQGQQQMQAPPVAQQVVGQAQQLAQAGIPSAQPTQTLAGGGIVALRDGGVARHFAGGGAVAFGQGGDVQYFSNGSEEFGILSDPSAYAMDELRVEQARKKRQLRELENSYYYLVSQNDPRAAQVKQQLEALARTESTAPTARPTTPAMTPQQMEMAVRPAQTGGLYSSGIDEVLAAERARRAGQSQRIGTGQRAPAPAPAPAEGVASLMDTSADINKFRANQLAYEQARRKAAQLPQGALDARQQMDELLKSLGTTYGTEEERRAKVLEEMVAKAQARRDAPRLQSSAVLEGMLQGAMAGGRKASIGEILAGAGAGAMSGVRKLEEAVTAAEKERALGQERLFDLRLKKEQLRMDQAKLNEARALGDKKLEDEAELDVVRSKQELANLERQVAKDAQDMAIKQREVAAREKTAQAALASAGKPSDFEQRVRLFTEKPEQYRTMFGIDPKETSVELRALKDEEQQLLKRLEATMLPDARKPIEKRLDEIINMRRILMGTTSTGSASDPLGIRK